MLAQCKTVGRRHSCVFWLCWWGRHHYDGANSLPDNMQVREDVTRYRYGDEQHLEEALARVFLFNRPKGLPRK